jgi:hypothetical protein
MSLRVRLTGAMVAVLICAVTAPALAQDPFASPVLRDKPKGGFATVTPTPTATASATASPSATPTATPRSKKHGQLADTGTDPLRLALAGLALLGFGFSLRLRIALADARRRPV